MTKVKISVIDGRKRESQQKLCHTAVIMRVLQHAVYFFRLWARVINIAAKSLSKLYKTALASGITAFW